MNQSAFVSGLWWTSPHSLLDCDELSGMYRWTVLWFHSCQYMTVPKCITLTAILLFSNMSSLHGIFSLNLKRLLLAQHCNYVVKRSVYIVDKCVSGNCATPCSSQCAGIVTCFYSEKAYHVNGKLYTHLLLWNW